MSDFAGLWRLDGRPVDDADVRRLAHGMDARGIGAPRVVRDGPLAFVHRQHFFTPEDMRERMPIVGTAQTILAADVRVDNRAELAEALGHEDGSRATDSALLIAALERWGADALARVHGDFALAWWRPDARRLLLARAPSRNRALFVHRSDRLIAFATRLRPLLALPDIPRDLDEAAVAERLVLADGAPERTQYRAIDRVPPAHLLDLDASGSGRSRAWWSLPQPASLRFGSFAETIEAARDVLDRAVAPLTRAVGPVACQLTGGLDSTAVTMTAHRMLAPDQIVAVTRVPDGPSPSDTATHFYDDAALAQQFAAQLTGLEWCAVPGDGGDWGEHDPARWYLEAGTAGDNPVNTAWFFPLYRFLAGRGGRVMLCGDAGNIFYSWGGGAAGLSLLRRGHIGALVRLLRDRSRTEGRSLAFAVNDLLLRPYHPLWLVKRRRKWPDPYWSHFSAISPAFAAQAGLDGRIDHARYRLRCGRGSPDSRFARETMFLGPGDGDSIGPLRAMSGVEMRDPLSDRRLVEFFAALPDEVFVHGGVRRAPARAILAGRAPQRILTEKRRGRQLGDWHAILSRQLDTMRADVVRLRRSPQASAIIDLDRIERLLAHWPADADAAEKSYMAHYFVLSRGLEYARFLAWHEGGNG